MEELFIYISEEDSKQQGMFYIREGHSNFHMDSLLLLLSILKMENVYFI